MTRTDYKVVFTALGFLAVILRDGTQDEQGSRARAIAELIEAFCKDAVPEAFAAGPSHPPESVLRDAMEALELCLEDGDLTFSSEQAAERSVSAIKRLVTP